MEVVVRPYLGTGRHAGRQAGQAGQAGRQAGQKTMADRGDLKTPYATLCLMSAPPAPPPGQSVRQSTSPS